MEQFEVKNGQLIWNSGDTRNLSLNVNETEYDSASVTSGVITWRNEKQDPSQLTEVDIGSGVKGCCLGC